MDKRVLQRVVIGMDFGQPSVRAARWAARTFGPETELVLVHVVPVLEPPPFLEWDVERGEELTRLAGERAQGRLSRLAGSLPRRDVQVELRRGRPVEELALAAAVMEADLLVVGEYGPRRGQWGALGSSAAQVPGVASLPVLVKRHLPERNARRLLAAVDHSEVSAVVLEWTRLLVERRRQPGEVVVHLSLEPEWSEGLAPAPGGGSGRDRERADRARAWLSGRAADAGLGEATIDVSVGDPRYEILALQRRYAIDLVVIGRRGAGSASPPLLGSVGSAVFQAAFCSVLLV
jgi:nucleotide-binding universal stress UspA family protein